MIRLKPSVWKVIECAQDTSAKHIALLKFTWQRLQRSHCKIVRSRSKYNNKKFTKPDGPVDAKKVSGPDAAIPVRRKGP